ncbi:hypothetical protein ACWNS2_16140 [Planococcus plakortidis]|uniref:hypothetical protein n=1 Tax=Planococcus plakortidis TaxID=1038856 RepID=UPI00385C4204
MIPQENITTLKRLGVESGKVGIRCLAQNATVIIEFFDEESTAGIDVDFILEEIELAEMCFIKEAKVIGGVNLERIKTSEEAEKVERLLTEKIEKMMPELIIKAKAYAQEVRERAGIPVEVVDDFSLGLGVMTEHDRSMWHAGEVLRGIDDDY